ncbi:hypothetical protein C1646_665065 [Rhizophagus diaphanus]|nr:hypothetical protein C1646_665065 [Rhizophagus diaphanus] [Rhizophagus sp. MUCL 43196]
MAYVECIIWPFSDDIDHYEMRCRAMKKGHTHYIAKALIDTTSTANFIRKSVADKLGIKYNIPPKDSPFYDPNMLGYTILDLSFRYKGEDRLLSGFGRPFNYFTVVDEAKADLVFGLPWMDFRETTIDLRKRRIKICAKSIPLLFKDPNTGEFLSKQNSRSDSDFEKQAHEVSSIIYP